MGPLSGAVLHPLHSRPPGEGPDNSHRPYAGRVVAVDSVDSFYIFKFDKDSPLPPSLVELSALVFYAARASALAESTTATGDGPAWSPLHMSGECLCTLPTGLKRGPHFCHSTRLATLVFGVGGADVDDSFLVDNWPAPAL